MSLHVCKARTKTLTPADTALWLVGARGAVLGWAHGHHGVPPPRSFVPNPEELKTQARAKTCSWMSTAAYSSWPTWGSRQDTPQWGSGDLSAVHQVRAHQLSSVQSLSRVRPLVTPWTAAHQASLSITISWSLLKPISIESVMPSNHLILCRLMEYHSALKTNPLTSREEMQSKCKCQGKGDSLKRLQSVWS